MFNNICNRNIINKVTSNTFLYVYRNYAFKSDLNIKWVRPTKIPCYKPEKSGDLSPLQEVPKSTVQLEFQQSKELVTANDLVKRLFTLEFAPRWKSTQVTIKDTVDLVRRHELDKGSMEARIARWTGAIRSLQEVMERFPRNKHVKVRLKELIDKRKKHLKYLRKWDYKRFEWLLEKLDIVYKPVPDYNLWHQVTRKDSLRRLTNIHCETIRNERLAEYRAALEAEQPGFLEEKIKTLEFIRREQQECGVPVTIEQKEIDDTKAQLAELLKQREIANEVE